MTVSTIIIDDDIDTVEIYKEYLEIKGINVVGTGHNGKDAVSLYSQQKPDMALLDVMMPEYDGLYAVRHIRENHPEARVIMATADKTQETRTLLEALDVNGIIYKPYEIDSVLDAINKVIRGEKVYTKL